MNVRDSERYKDYASTARPAFEQLSTNFLASSATFTESESKPRARNAASEVITFMQHAVDFYNSPEYQVAEG